MAFELAELDLSPETVEVTSVPDLRTSMPDDVDSLSFVMSEWPIVYAALLLGLVWPPRILPCSISR